MRRSLTFDDLAPRSDDEIVDLSHVDTVVVNRARQMDALQSPIVTAVLRGCITRRLLSQPAILTLCRDIQVWSFTGAYLAAHLLAIHRIFKLCLRIVRANH